MNIIGLTGNAVRDVELKYTQSGTAIGSGTIAVRRDFKNKQTNEYETDFINFTAFGKTAEIMGNHIRKGDKFGINGRLQIDTYEKDGQKKYFTNVVVNGFDFPDKKKEQGQAPQQQYNPPQSPDPFNNDGRPIEISDDDLPF